AGDRGVRTRYLRLTERPGWPDVPSFQIRDRIQTKLLNEHVRRDNAGGRERDDGEPREVSRGREEHEGRAVEHGVIEHLVEPEVAAPDAEERGLLIEREQRRRGVREEHGTQSDVRGAPHDESAA